jgi:hypothetical protein
MSVMEAPAEPRSAGANWVQAGPARWVAANRGDVVGVVEQVGQRFLAFDDREIEIGSYEDLDTAQHQVQRPASRAYEARLWRRRQSHELHLAWATMWVASIVLVASIVMVGLGLFT